MAGKDQEYPLLVDKKLACAIGLNNAIVVRQLMYWLEKNREKGQNSHEGYYWTYNSYEEWQQEDFPFWSLSQIQRVFADLVKKDIVVVGHFNKQYVDRTNWYRLDTSVLLAAIDEYEKSPVYAKSHKRKIASNNDVYAKSHDHNAKSHDGICEIARSVPEITPEITPEHKNKIGGKPPGTPLKTGEDGSLKAEGRGTGNGANEHLVLKNASVTQIRLYFKNPKRRQQYADIPEHVYKQYTEYFCKDFAGKDLDMTELYPHYLNVVRVKLKAGSNLKEGQAHE